MSTQTIDSTLLAEMKKSQPAQNSQNQQNSVDNNKNNSYINNDGEKAGSQPAIDNLPNEKIKNLLEVTFGGDSVKLAESYAELQATFTERNRELKKTKETQEQLDRIFQSNPALFDIVKRASQGENVENLLRQNGTQQGQSVPANNATQFEVSNDVDEKALIESGYLDVKRKDQLTDYEWNREVLRATHQYLNKETPKRIVKQAMDQLREAQEAQETEKRKKQTIEENHRRYTDGIKQAALSGWDFTKDHEQYLDELEEEIVGLRDPKNLHLLRQDAVEIALDRIAKRHGVQVRKPQVTGQQVNPGRNYNQTNINSRQVQDPNEPKTFLDKVVARGIENSRNKNGDYLKRYLKE